MVERLLEQKSKKGRNNSPNTPTYFGAVFLKNHGVDRTCYALTRSLYDRGSTYISAEMLSEQRGFFSTENRRNANLVSKKDAFCIHGGHHGIHHRDAI